MNGLTGVSTQRKRREGPRGLPILGSFLQLVDDPLRLALQAHAEYGDVVRVYLKDRPFVFLRHPQDVKRVLIDEAQGFHNPTVSNAFNGNGLTVSKGEYWKRQRNMIQPLFHRAKVQLWNDILNDEVRKALARWRDMAREGQPLDVYVESTRVMFDVLWRICFDEQPTGEMFKYTLDALTRFGSRPPPLLFLLVTLFPALRPKPERVAAMVEPINRWIYERLGKRRARGPLEDDVTLLSMLVEARAKGTGEAMTDVEIRDEVVNLFGASFEMLGTMVVWAVYVLGQRPDLVQRIREEVRGVTQGGEPNPDDVPKLAYTSRVVQEIIRIYPPTWVLNRETAEACTFGDMELAPKTRIAIFPYAVHRHPEFWQDVEVLDPDRFLPEHVSARHKCAYIPFGAGQRMCVGQHMSLVHATYMVAALVHQMDIEPLHRRPLELETRLPMLPKGGVTVRLKPLQA